MGDRRFPGARKTVKNDELSHSPPSCICDLRGLLTLSNPLGAFRDMDLTLVAFADLVLQREVMSYAGIHHPIQLIVVHA
jgi:hypothetical protein